MVEPKSSRPFLPPGYGAEKATTRPPGDLLSWDEVRGQLVAARNYWLCTTRPDGRPHVKPVWGIWFDDGLLFSTHPDTVAAQNLRSAHEVAVHLESGDQALICEGSARRTHDRSLLARFGAEYESKYDWPMSPEDIDPENPHAAFYQVRPRQILSWSTALEVGETITRWAFDAPRT